MNGEPPGAGAQRRRPSEDARERRPRARGLFRRFPHGLLLVDASRRVVDLNDKARQLLILDQRRGESDGWTCCELVCDPLADQAGIEGTLCMTERALETGEPLPEVEITVRCKRDLRAVRVTAARVDAEDVRVLFQLRAGAAGPAARDRTEPRPTDHENELLRIRTLGGLRIERAGEALGGRWVEQRAGLLLKYLICHRRGPAASEQIAEALWPDATPREALASLRHYVHVLRERLEPGRPRRSRSPFVETRRGGYMLSPDDVWLDADELERGAQEGLRLFAAGQLEGAADGLESAMAVYGGEFLADGPDAEWVLEERERLHELVARASATMIEIKLASGDLDSAGEHSRRLADMQPLDGEVQRQFIEICLKRGQRSDAVRRYELLRSRTLREFGQEPDFTLSDLSA
jgi:DNA-binding SARP family transcriptional activator